MPYAPSPLDSQKWDMKKRKVFYTLYDRNDLIDPESAIAYSIFDSLEKAQKMKQEMFNETIIIEEVVEIEDKDTQVIERNIVDEER